MGKLGWALVCAVVLAGTACGDNSRGAGPVSIGSDGDGGFSGAHGHDLGGYDLGSFVTGLTLTPATVTFTLADRPAVMAIATLAAGGRRDVTSQVTWTTGTDGIAAISDGQITPLAVGSTSITATLNELTADGQVTVTPAATVVASLSISAENATLPIAATMQYHATATMDDGTQRDVTTQTTWSISPSIATIDGNGLATGGSPGNATVTASWSHKTDSVPLTVTSAQLVRLDIDPVAFSLAAGFTKTATATAVYNDGSTLDVTALAQWSATPTKIATVAPLGIVTGHVGGAATLSATFGQVTGTAAITVTAAQLVSLEISPPVLALVLGGELQLTATGVFSDGAHADLTTQVMWTSNALGSAMVSTTGKLTSEGVGVAVIRAQLGTITAAELAVITAATLTQIQLPSTATLPIGRWTDLAPTGVYSDGTTAQLTSNVTYSTSDVTVASISANGRITANGPGDAIITVTSGAITSQVHVTVTSAVLVSVLVTPVSVTLTAGATAHLSAMGTYSDASVVDVTAQGAWSSVSSATATVSNASKGLVTGVAPGATTVSVVVAGIAASAAITVTAATLTDLTITPPALVMPTGTDAYLVASARYSDNTGLDLTTQVTWTSSDPTIATVSNAAGTFGHLTAKAAGSATITATKGAVTKTASVTVTPAILTAIQLPAQALTIPRGLTAPVTALGIYSDGSVRDLTASVDWTSDTSAVASVSNLVGSTGIVTANTVGTAILTASYNGNSSTIGVTVTASVLQAITLPASMTVPKGLALPVIATGVYSDGSTIDITSSVTWSSSAPTVASVSNVAGSLGLVTGNSVGDATLTASYQNHSATTGLHVSSALLSSISLGASTLTVPRGLTVPIIATGTYSDGATADLTSNVTWTSSAPAVATVSSLALSAGLVTGVSQGSATITATLGSNSSTTAVTVTSAVLTGIQLPTSTITVPRGLGVPVTATGLYSDGSLADITANVSWSSSAPTIASVSGLAASLGVVTGIAVGDATLSATMNGQTATVPVHVTSAVLAAIQLPAAAVTVPKGLTLPILATGVYTDGSTADLTTSVSWTSSAPGVASVSGIVATAGLVTGVAQGTASVTATLGSTSASTTITVTTAVLSALQLPQAAVTVPRGLTLPLVVTGLYSDGSLADLTSSVTWTSSAPTIATVSGVAGSAGLVTGVSQGAAIITATIGAKSATTSVTVTAAVLSSISLPTGPVMVAKGLFTPIVATGLYSDGSTATLTQSVTWMSSAPSIATVSNLVASAGVVTGVQTGFATITATLGSATKTVQVQVTPAILSSISVGVPQLLGLLQVGVATATGTYSDGTTVDLTSQVSFGSSNLLAATVGASGNLLGLGIGTTTITATLGSLSASSLITVGSDACHLVINEIKAGTLLKPGDNFVEIYNPCTYAVDVTQVSLVYRTATGTTDILLAQLSDSISPNAYRLFAGPQYSSGGTVDGSFTTTLAGVLGGGVGLRMAGTGTLLDSVAWGASTNEGVLLGAITLGSTLARIPNGRDTNSNLADFALLSTSTPRAANQ